MKKYIVKVLIINSIILSIPVYLLGLTDSAFQQVYPSDTIFSYLINSVRYFVFWVLPYWGIFIMIASILLTFVYFVIRKIIK